MRAIDDALKLQADEAALRLHRRHHQVVERRCCAGALRLHHCGFGSRCQLCSQDTHWLYFSVLTLFTTTRLLRRFRRCPGRLLCGERVAAPPGRHCPGRGLLRLPLHRRAAGRSCCVSKHGAGCGTPAQAQASARVDVPTAHVFPVWTKESNTCASFCCECLDMCLSGNQP